MDNFAACQSLYAKEAGLPFISPLVHQLRESQNAPKELVNIFQFVQYFGGSQEAEVVKQESPEIISSPDPGKRTPGRP